VFAPPVGWVYECPDDERDYVTQMRRSYRAHKAEWDTVLAAKRVVLVCSCEHRHRCHRSTLAKILARCGARVYGEILEWDLTE
jgi:uncharacterized protein (DUF488 family)